jgi:hypothetical protein
MIRDYYDTINDNIYDSKGPYDSQINALGWQGCWDRDLHWERNDAPVHEIVHRLQSDFGKFEIYASSIRYLVGPFLPHSDIVSKDWLADFKTKYREGYIFLIPLSWRQEYAPGTVILSSPPRLDEPLYDEIQHLLPHFSESFQEHTKEFSVKKTIQWQSPGDLIAWKNFQWHASCDFSNTAYQRDIWQKEFLNFKTAIPLS